MDLGWGWSVQNAEPSSSGVWIEYHAGGAAAAEGSSRYRERELLRVVEVSRKLSESLTKVAEPQDACRIAAPSPCRKRSFSAADSVTGFTASWQANRTPPTVDVGGVLSDGWKPDHSARAISHSTSSGMSRNTLRSE